jgi:glycerol-3-phosphate responsive antiterminator
MLEMLKLKRIASKLIGLINMTLEDLQARVVIENYLTQRFDVNVAVRQGDALLVSLSNLVLDYIIKKLDARGNISTKMAEINAYVDNVVIISRI